MTEYLPGKKEGSSMYSVPKRLLAAMLLMTLGMTAKGGEVAGLTTFTSGTPALAAEVNGNFDAVANAVNDNHTRISDLEAANTALEARVAALEEKLASMSLLTVNGNPTVRFTGVNLQVVNGLDVTTTANGTGNLIVGYDEADTSGTYRCTLGSKVTTGPFEMVNDPAPSTGQIACTGAGGTWTNMGFKSGSHYIVAGSGNNYSRWGGIVIGYRNTASTDYASVTGGHDNLSSGYASNVIGGSRNQGGGIGTVIDGGYGCTSIGDLMVNAGTSNKMNPGCSAFLQN